MPSAYTHNDKTRHFLFGSLTRRVARYRDEANARAVATGQQYQEVEGTTKNRM